MIALLLHPAARYVLGALALIAAYFWIDGRGYDRAASEYKARIAVIHASYKAAEVAETERQATANNAAKAREAARIAEMQAANESLQSQIEELEREASEDPDAGRAALGASSVRRINKVR